ncbi:MAG: hypothetical protein Q9159_002608 [Coniocarpon cinnabarinum]
MGKAMSNDTTGIIVRALAQGHSRGDIAKMCGVSTRAVTRALLVWIAARDYTFYVKDLVSYLKEHHAYKGCDGTVRRGMIRAGFKRREPYHKSEITVWIPPDHPPQFEIIAEDEPPHKLERGGHSLTTPPQAQQDAQQVQQMPAPPAHMTQNSSQDATMLDAYQNYYDQQSSSFPNQPSIPPLDPHLYQISSNPEASQAQPQQPLPFQPPSLPSQSEPPPQSPSQPRSVKSTPKKAKKSRKEDQLQSQVSSMHEEMMKQADLIRQLQMQLATQNQASSSTQGQAEASAPPMSAGQNDADSATEQRSPRQTSNSFQMQEEEVAV